MGHVCTSSTADAVEDISIIGEEITPRLAKAMAADCNYQPAAASFHEDEDNKLFC